MNLSDAPLKPDFNATNPDFCIDGRYRVLRPLGQGGMGVVYLAEDLQKQRPCAVKLLPARGLKQRRDLLRLRREFAAIARLSHPNCIGVYELGEYEGQPYYTMEYVAGG